MLGEQPYRFGPFLLDPLNAHVVRGTEKVPLTPKAFAVLHYLTEHRERLVNKKELLAALWPETVVGEGVLKASILELRKALGDNAKTPQFIETVHRRGYRFVAAVTPAASVQSSKFQVQSQEGVVSSRHSVVSGKNGTEDWELGAGPSPQATSHKPQALLVVTPNFPIFTNCWIKSLVVNARLSLLPGSRVSGRRHLSIRSCKA